MLKFVSDWELDFLNVWGWGTATLITVAAATLALTVLALLTLGFWRGPAWMHVAIIPAPFIAGAAAIPLLLFAVLWLAVVIIRIAMVIGALIFLFHILKGLFE